MATRLRITGLVQGVGYRASFEVQARRLGLSGWVRNLTDGSVEATVDGGSEAIDSMIAWAKRGPSAAKVRDVVVSTVDDTTVIDGCFEVRATA